MQVDPSYGIIPDSQDQILQNYLSFFSDVFPNATSPNDPTYVIASACSLFDKRIQDALQVLSNNVNSNTAKGLGLDILANTILNLYRKKLTPSTCVIKFDVQNLLSYCDVTIDVTIASPPKTVPVNWTVTGTVSPSPAYKTLSTYTLAASGTYVIRVFSTDLTTNIPIAGFNAGDAISGVTFNSVSNLGPGVLGELVIPADWAVTASTLNPSPTYVPGQAYVYNTLGTKYMLVYSSNLTTNLNALQLNTFPQINNLNPTPAPMIDNLSNPNPNVLGDPPEDDAQFSARRRYYLNIEGQTYYGLEKVILNIGAPALNSVFVAETITNSFNSSILILKVNITYSGSPVVIPIGYGVTVSTGTPPTSPYVTQSAYTFITSGPQYIPLFSPDITNQVGIGEVTGAVTPVTGVTVVGNLDPSILGVTVGLGQRGYTVYLDYPLNGPGGTTFDTQDVYLQKIASACFEYHPLGTQFYSGGSGATTFVVNTPYGSYTSNVILNPLQVEQVTVNLTLTYNTDPQKAGYNGAIFTANLATLKQNLLNLINEYFRSKTLPTDLVYTITELSELIQNAYTGIVALSSPTQPFVFGTISPSASNLLFLTRTPGYVFNLTNVNFNFTATPIT